MSSSYAHWAKALTAERLATHLESVARDVRTFDLEQRPALLREAARRIRRNHVVIADEPYSYANLRTYANMIVADDDATAREQSLAIVVRALLDQAEGGAT